MDKTGLRAGLDLDKDDHSLSCAHQVKFAFGTPPISIQDPVASFLKVFAGRLLSLHSPG
jgi:hypothetical protein